MAKVRSLPSRPKLDTVGTRREPTGFTGRRFTIGGHVVTGFWIGIAALITGFNLNPAQQFERSLQTFFFEIRGPVAPPQDIVIIQMDDLSFSQPSFYDSDPAKYSYLEPILNWPWQRTAYAEVLDKVLGAGAKAVAVDVIFETSSGYGEADDQRLEAVLAKYRHRIVLASQYDDGSGDTEQGEYERLVSPLAQFKDSGAMTGLINYPVESNGRIHQFSHQFVTKHAQTLPDEQAEGFYWLLGDTPSFAVATLMAAGFQRTDTQPNSNIYFYGPGWVFPHKSFVEVLDPENWTKLQQENYFKDKIVLIGATAQILQDFHPAPFGQSVFYPQRMAGVEIHAQAIATLLQNRAIGEAIPLAPLRGVFVLLIVGLAGWTISRPRQPLRRVAWAVGWLGGWLLVGYLTFTYGRQILPTAVPAGAIALGGVSQLVAGIAREQQKKKQLRATLRQYATSPIVQEIISQQDDLQDLLRERELALSGKLLSGRYRIIRVLGSGGFSETYVSEDIQRPGNPLCVVKQLQLESDNPNTLKLARRLFATEAETLERLGQHDQIPQLLACFEENDEFYLVQEFIPGRPLSMELLPHRPWSEDKVVLTLYDLLNVLEFVHRYGVIHRDLKPSNIIRRKIDNKLVVIDFGIAKKITTQLADLDRQTKFTVAVGTPGYMPSEQSAGRPHFNSDIYALGIIAIEALTGIAPQSFKHDEQTGEILWHDHAPLVSPEFKKILDKMVRHDFTQRYVTVDAVLSAMSKLDLLAISNASTALDDESGDSAALLDSDDDDDASDTVHLPEDWGDQDNN